MSTFDEIRHAFVWSSCTGVEERGRQFDEWFRGELEQTWEEGFTDAEYEYDGYSGESGWRRDNPYRKEENA